MKNLRHSRAQKRIILVLVVVIAGAGLFAASKHLCSNPPFRLLLGAYDFICTYYIETLDLVMDVSLAEQTIDCTTTLSIRPEKNSRAYLSFVLADNFAIESALLNGTPAKVWRLWLLNIIRIPQGQRHQPLELTLTYRGQPQSTFLSIDPGFMSLKGAALLTNDLWLPHMTRKAPGEVDSTYTIKVPQGYQIATAGRPGKTSAEGGKTAQRWENTNLASILIEPFTVTGHAGSKDFRIFTPPQYAHLGPKIARLADEIVHNYEMRLGAIEPRNINIAFSEGSVSGFYIGGLITIPTNRLEQFAAVIDLPGSSAYEDFYHLLTHELGHMWWQNAGDNVSELIGIQWFSEGITEFASLWLTGEKLGRHVYMERLNRGVERIRREENLRAIDQYAYWEHSPIPYYKGAMMLESLRLQEGIGPVFEFLADMSQLPKGPKTPEMAAEIALRVFGRDYTAFFQHWISGAKPLALRVADHNIEDKNVQLTVVSSQAAELPLEIAVVYKEEMALKHFPLSVYLFSP
ncbi:MAG TPA: M1 family metallopeptidase, partial [Firmicutes bacterium]|nr:M1 family metallopeptidase [Bacillota bacterium]